MWASSSPRREQIGCMFQCALGCKTCVRLPWRSTDMMPCWEVECKCVDQDDQVENWVNLIRVGCFSDNEDVLQVHSVHLHGNLVENTVTGTSSVTSTSTTQAFAIESNLSKNMMQGMAAWALSKMLWTFASDLLNHIVRSSGLCIDWLTMTCCHTSKLFSQYWQVFLWIYLQVSRQWKLLGNYGDLYQSKGNRNMEVFGCGCEDQNGHNTYLWWNQNRELSQLL